MGLQEREEKRKKSIVSSMIQEEIQEPPTKKEKLRQEKREDRVQKSYFIDKDLYKALQIKSITEEINLTEAMNKALRAGLKDYINKLKEKGI